MTFAAFHAPARRFPNGGALGAKFIRAHRRRTDQEQLIGPGDAALFHSIVDHSQDGVAIVDRAGCIAYCNVAVADMFSTTAEDLIGREFGFPLGAHTDVTPLEIFTGDCPRFVEMRTKPLFWNKADATQVSLRDVTEKHESNAELDMHAMALEAIANGVFITDTKGVICWANSALEGMSGYTLQELLSRPASVLKSGAHDAGFYADMWARAKSGESWRGRVVNRRKDGSMYTVDQVITPVRDATGRLSRYVAIQEDISERLRAEDRVTRLTDYDALTGLPNRRTGCVQR